MRGDLVEKTAADVCRDLAASDASGVLAVDGPDGPGRVVFSGGRIIAAMSPAPRARLGDRLVGAGELDAEALATALESQGVHGTNARLGELLAERGLVHADVVRAFLEEQVLDALFEIIRWRYGTYAFITGGAGVIGGIPISLAVDDALVDIARRQQEWQQLSRVIPDLEAIPSFRPGAASASASLEPDEFAVLASVDGERSIRGLAAKLGYGEFEAARIVYGLSLLGIVDVRLPQDAVGAALEDALGSAPQPAEPGVDPPQPPEPVGQSADFRPPPPDFFASPSSTAPLATDDVDATDADVGAEKSGDVPDPTGGDDIEPTVDEGDDGITLDITFDVDPRPEEDHDEPPGGDHSEPPETTPASAFAELYADAPRRPPGKHARADEPPRDAPASDPDAQAGRARASTDDGHAGGTGSSRVVEPGTDGAMPSARTAPQRGDDNDVSEFLRELSRLSVDAPRPRSSPPEPDPPPPPPPPPREPGRKKRRGFFGRG